MTSIQTKIHSFIRFPSVLKDLIQSSLMVDLEYDPSSIPEDRVRVILDWINKKSREEVVQSHEVIFNHLLNEDQLKVVIHSLRSLGHEFDVSIRGEGMFSTVFTLNGWWIFLPQKWLHRPLET